MTTQQNPVVSTLSGMTMHEMVALAALPVVIGVYKDHNHEQGSIPSNGTLHEHAAQIAWAYADAFMQERNRRIES